MFWQGKRVLITGGTGFVGAHLAERLVNEHADVVTTFQSSDPHAYFSQQKLGQKVALINLDIRNSEGLFHLITKYDIQYVFHLAAQAIVEVAYNNPLQTLDSNIMGTTNILEAARLFPKIQGLIVASSDKAYGKKNQSKYIETDRLAGDHPYEVSKSAADLITQSYVKTYGVPVIITRFGNIYGEGDLNYSRIVPGLLRAMIERKTLELRSDGTFVRDYLYVQDVVDGYLLAAEQMEKMKGEAFNFGSAETLSVLELIDLSKKILRTDIRIHIQNVAKNEISYQSLDFTKATEKLGWVPKRTLTDTLPQIHRYYESVLQ